MSCPFDLYSNVNYDVDLEKFTHKKTTQRYAARLGYVQLNGIEYSLKYERNLPDEMYYLYITEFDIRGEKIYLLSVYNVEVYFDNKNNLTSAVMDFLYASSNEDLALHLGIIKEK